MSNDIEPDPQALRLETELSRRSFEGRYPTPAFDGHSLPNLAASALARGTGKRPEGILPPLRRDVEGEADDAEETQLVLLIDSFGWRMFRHLLDGPGGATGLAVARGLVPYTRPITSVFPPTTSSALLSLSTAVAPGTHGIGGYTEYFPWWGAVLNTLRFAPPWSRVPDLAVGKCFTRADWLPTPNLFAHDPGAVALTKEMFEGSPFTSVLYEGAEFVGFSGLSGLTRQLTHLLERPEGRRPRLLWAYWDMLDTVNHVFGPEPGLASSELTEVFLALARAARSVGEARARKVHLWVTGDHGQVRVTPETSRAAHADPRLLELLDRPPAGERRAAFLKAREGKVDELRTHLGETLPGSWLTVPVERVLSSGLLGPGPFHPELKARLGDLLVLPGPGEALYSRPPGDRGPEEHFLWGSHGGLDPDELLVSLVSLPFSELARWPV